MGQQSSQAVGLSGDGTSTRTLPDGSVETTTTQNGRVVEVRITGIPGQAFTSVDTLFGSDGKPTSVTRAGYRGAPYVETVATYGSTGSIAQIAFLTAGGATYSTLTYAADGSFSVDHAGITGQAYTDLTNTYTSARHAERNTPDRLQGHVLRHARNGLSSQWPSLRGCLPVTGPRVRGQVSRRRR